MRLRYARDVALSVTGACPATEVIAALAAGELPDADRVAIADHGASCDVCYAVLAGLLGRPGSRAPTAGDRVGRYVIEERLGAGGMGVVFAALDSALQRRVALKLVRSDADGRTHGGGGSARLMREAQTLARLSHPNIVAVHDVGEGDDGRMFIAMELVDGGSLTAWLRRAPRSVEERIDRMIEAGRGLVAAHAAGVVHRDVKPDNILVGLDGRARVTDFGLAHEHPGTGAVVGTPVYMAPEQTSGGETGAWTDQWAFCATLYEVLAGVRPFPGGDAAARAAAITEGRLAAPADGHRLPAWIRPIVARGLRGEPAARWPSMDAVVGALVRGRRRRGRRLRALGIAAGALGAGGLVLGVLARRPEGDARAAAAPAPVCDCPYSACVDGTCVSQCDARAFRIGAAVPGVSLPGRQEALLGASADGATILYLAGKRCAIDRLHLARRRGTAYESTDITDALDRSRVAFFDGCCTVAPDGGSIVFPTPDGSTFVRARLTGTAITSYDDADFGVMLPDPQPGRTVRHPVISHDGRTLYYRVHDRVEHRALAGRFEAAYETTRRDLRTRFTAGERMQPGVTHYDHVSGISSDGLSLFMNDEFTTRVLVRATTSEPFGGVTAPRSIAGLADPAALWGWRAVPVAGCDRVLTTITPGGCATEDVTWLEAERD